MGIDRIEKFAEDLDATNAMAITTIFYEYENFCRTRDFIASVEDTQKFFESLGRRFSLRNVEEVKFGEIAYHIARNLLLSAGMLNGGYNKWFAHPSFLYKEDSVIFYQCLAIMKVFKFTPPRD